MLTVIIIVAAFVGAATLVGGVAIMLRGDSNNNLEERLDVLAGAKSPAKRGPGSAEANLLAQPLDETRNFAEVLFSRFVNLRTLLQQADTSMTPTKFLFISLGCAGGGTLICLVSRIHPAFLPLAAIMMGLLPFAWVVLKRKRRLKAFAKQLPEALELISRALRAGHSLAAGMSLVADEMADPIGKEFSRCYEEQNFGIPLDEALDDMTQRVPNLDLRFFATAVILQRQTGGDLAEILDKIGTLIRERFKIWGQIQALTGEGRLSGLVLLGLPPALFIAMYRLNPDYCMILFKDPMGHQMLAVAVVMQVIGALVIRKIVNIKV